MNKEKRTSSAMDDFYLKENRCGWFKTRNTLLFALLLFTVSKPLLAKGIILGDRFKIEPEIAAMESYDDNIYLSESDTESDYITTIMPGLDMQLALSSHSRIEILYLGLFNYYRDADNFNTGHHYGDTNFTVETAKGSQFKIGAWGEDANIQPYSIDDQSKDYTIGALYTDINVNIFASTEVYGTYQYNQRRFDEDRYQEDNYDRNAFAIGIVNSMSALFPILLEYRYENQQNDDATPEPTELLSQAAFTGFKWGADQRLSGSLRVGYLWSDYNDHKGYDGWATDTELTYRIGPFTALTAVAERGVRESTRTARDTLDYYVYAGAGLSLTYSAFDPLRLTLMGDYENRDYRSALISRADREDDFYVAGATLRYRIRDWLAFSLAYRYRMNDSTLDALDYQENLVSAEIILLSVGDVRRKRRPDSLEKFKYF
jgi:hypothetical protein